MFPLLLLFSQNRCTPLYIASQEGHTGVVELLLQHNAEPNISDEVSHSMTRLHVHVSIAQCMMWCCVYLNVSITIIILTVW